MGFAVIAAHRLTPSPKDARSLAAGVMVRWTSLRGVALLALGPSPTAAADSVLTRRAVPSAWPVRVRVRSTWKPDVLDVEIIYSVGTKA